jgi:murein DD-endopeptidase MepM/ murein hydrolase activator NlpD
MVGGVTAGRSRRMGPLARATAIALSIGGVVWMSCALPYVNWTPVAAPLPEPLVIRADAKGDGRFGAPRSGRRQHRGIDLQAGLGTPVRAIRSGRVEQQGWHAGFGRFVVLRHGRGMTSLYAHLGAAVVRQGDRVRQGQVVGTVGKTGNARHPLITPRLHLEISRGGVPVDPSALGLTAREPMRASMHAAGGES